MLGFGIGVSEILMIPVCFLIFGLFVYSLVRRLRKKLGPASKPKVWNYINELGGYFVVGLIILVAAVASLISGLFGGT